LITAPLKLAHAVGDRAAGRGPLPPGALLGTFLICRRAMPETWAEWIVLGAAGFCAAAAGAFLLAYFVTSERA
jgi:hypothetical protein